MSTIPTITAQLIARDILRLVGIPVPAGHDVAITDTDETGDQHGFYVVNPSQLIGAAEQYWLTTGETVDAEALLSALPWV